MLKRLGTSLAKKPQWYALFPCEGTDGSLKAFQRELSVQAALRSTTQARQTVYSAQVHSRNCASTPINSSNLEGISKTQQNEVFGHESTGVAARLLVDTLQMMKEHEANGLSRGQAEALTRQITNTILSQLAHNEFKYVPKEQLERILVEWRADQKHLQQDVLVKQEVHVASVSKDVERLQAQLDKFKADIKHEVDKLTANQKLDLNLERGRIRDEMQQLRDKVVTLHSGMEKEVNSVRTDIESSKSDTLKWVVVTVGGLLGAGFAAIRLSLAV